MEFVRGVQEWIEYSVRSLIIGIALPIVLLELLLTGMLFSVIVDVPWLGGLFLLSILIIMATEIVRAVWAVFRFLRWCWLTFRPPYQSSDFQFRTPITKEDFSYHPEESAIRGISAFLLVAVFLWTPIHYLLRYTQQPIFQTFKWAIGLLPSTSVEGGVALLYLVFGFPTPGSVSSSFNWNSAFEAALHLPSLILGTLLIWNVMYYVERQLVSSQENRPLSPVVEGDFFHVSWGELDNLKYWLSTARSGLETDSWEELRWLGSALILSNIILFVTIGMIQITGY